MALQCVLRMCRRRSSWELTDPLEIARIEFQRPADGALDLRPSVYCLYADGADELHARVVQARAEHAKSFARPPSGQGTFQVDAFEATQAEVIPSGGGSLFAYTREAHAELHLRDEAELLELVRRLMDELGARSFEVSREDLLDFMIERFAARDPEWVAALAPGRIGDWDKPIQKRRAQKSQTARSVSPS